MVTISIINLKLGHFKPTRDADLRIHLFLQLVSQDSAQELFRRTIAPYFGASRIEFQLCCLWTRFVSQGVVCFHSVGFGGHLPG